jgi:hypothetical protein
MRAHLFLLSVGLLLLTAAAPADEPAARTKKLLGTWERSAGGTKIMFQFKADLIRVTVEDGGTTVDVEGDYGVTKNGMVFGIVTKVTKTGTSDGPSEGDVFRFRFTPDGKKATLDELKPANEEVKKIIEGTYERKAD